MVRTPDTITAYRRQIRKALGDPTLRAALDRFAAAYPGARRAAFSGTDFQGLRGCLAALRADALKNTDALFAAFRSSAEEKGAIVHVARTADDACEIIFNIAHNAGVKKIIKSKSMTSEEIFLNPFLENRGLAVTETDLGEWIIQLRREGPSHMVMPAIHLSRNDVAELFQKVTGEFVDPNDIAGQVRVARSRLRHAFLEADMGISGANFAIADSGTIGIVTNEGNARLVTTLPRVHVALLGFDKLVPDLKTALNILRVLPRSATGQEISTYVTWIAGAAACAVGPGGVKDFHIVFLDNGRRKTARDPIFSEALRCIRCGACANVCPVYRMIGGHAYGHVYIGAIGLILTRLYHGSRSARALVQNCLNCQACKEVCPVGIDLPRLILQTRERVMAEEGRKPVKNLLLARVMKNRPLFHGMLKAVSKVQGPMAGPDRMVRHLPLIFEKTHGFRSLPVLAGTPLRSRWKAIQPKDPGSGLRVALFGGCLIDFVYPESAVALVKILSGAPVRLTYPMDQTCCGLPAVTAGEIKTAREVARMNLRAFSPARFDYILTLCASCGSHLKETVPKLLENTDQAETAAAMAARVIDFSSFMVDVIMERKDVMPAGKGQKVAYHAPCHLCRGLGVTRAPRQLIERSGNTYIPAAGEEICCGLGGSYALHFPEISRALLAEKLQRTIDAGADLLVTDCPGCVLQLRGGMHRRQDGRPVLHIAELVAGPCR